MTSLKGYFTELRDQDVHLQLTNRVVVDGTVLRVGDDALAVQTTPGTIMLVPFSAILFVRETIERFESRAAAG